MALRFGKLPDSNLVARKLIESPRMIAASPAYLEKAGIPKTPADLVNHKIVLGPSSASSVGWTFQKDGKKTSVRVDSKLMVTVNEGSISRTRNYVRFVSGLPSGHRERCIGSTAPGMGDRHSRSPCRSFGRSECKSIVASFCGLSGSINA